MTGTDKDEGSSGPLPLTAETEREGKPYRRIRVEGKRLRAVYSRLESLMREPGTIVSLGEAPTIGDWLIIHRAEADNGAVFLGPSFPGPSLAEEIARRSGRAMPMTEIACAEGFAVLSKVARAMAALEAAGRPLARFIPETVIVSDSAVLFLPVGLSDVAGGEAPGPVHLGSQASFASLVHEFALRLPGAALHSIPAGAGASRVGEAARRMRLSVSSPRLDSGIAVLADRGNGLLAKAAMPSMADWAEALSAAASRGWLAQAGAGESGKQGRKLASSLARGTRFLSVKAFARKQSLPIGVIAVVLAGGLIFGVPAAARRSSLAKGIQALGQEELVRAYYRSIDSLDSDFVDNAARRKASAKDSSMISSVQVFTKYREAMEGTEIRVRAVDWLAAEKPPLDGRILFGIANLRMEKTGQGDPAVFTAEYDLWTVETGKDGTSYGPVMRSIVDSVRLERWGRGFRIESIDRKEIPY